MAKEHPRYANTEWPDYEYREFPMMVYPGAKDPTKPEYHTEGRRRGKLKFAGVVVKNDAELKAVLSGEAELIPGEGAGTKRVQTADDERLDLINRLEVAGVQHDKRWGLARLQDAWDAHEAAGL